jgi:hypothetical protein
MLHHTHTRQPIYATTKGLQSRAAHYDVSNNKRRYYLQFLSLCARLVAACELRPLLGKQAPLHPPPASSSPLCSSLRMYRRALALRPFSSSSAAQLPGGASDPLTSRFPPARDHRVPLLPFVFAVPPAPQMLAA